MLHKEIWGLILLGWIVWIMTGTAAERLERACSPVGWTGNVTVSLAALATPAHQASVQKLFDKGTYGCQYIVWRLFYQGDYQKAQLAIKKDGEALNAAKEGSQTTSSMETPPAKKEEAAK